jgi:hypothetical protein
LWCVRDEGGDGCEREERVVPAAGRGLAEQGVCVVKAIKDAQYAVASVEPAQSYMSPIFIAYNC